MRRGLLLCVAATRALTPGNVLKTVRNDPGMTSTYYANRYFGKENVMVVNHVLWSVLKRSGRVDMDRADGADAPPRWYPLFANPRRHHVCHHNAEEEDLSLLRQPAPPSAPTAPAMPSDSEVKPHAANTASTVSSDEASHLEITIVELVGAAPGRDIQHYIQMLPMEVQRLAPAAFKRLREAGLLERRVTEQGTYMWF